VTVLDNANKAKPSAPSAEKSRVLPRTAAR
jgi:hypothetical protein